MNDDRYMRQFDFLRVMFISLLVLLLMLLAGCAGDHALRAQVAGANIELAHAQAQAFSQPIFEAEIPQAGAAPIKITFRNPSMAAQQVSMPDDPWARAVDRGVGVIGTLGGVWLGGEAAKGIVSATGSAVIGGIAASAKGSADALQSVPDPVVVTQPDPVVVQPPDPVIVPQPAPVIVTQPAPVIVDPVIMPQPEPVIVPAPDPIIVPPTIVQTPDPIIVNPVVVQP